MTEHLDGSPYQSPRAADLSAVDEYKLPDRPTNVRWLMFALACSTSWFLYLHRYTWNFIRPALADEYGFSNTQLEGLFTFFNLSYAFGQIPSGIFCDFIGPHGFLVVIILLWSLLVPTVGLTGNFSQLAGLRLLFGAAQAGGYPGLANVTQNWFPRRSRTIMQGFIASFFGRSGGAMSSIVMSALLMGMFGLTWRVSLVVMAVAGVVFAAVFCVLYRNKPEIDPRVNKAECDLIREGEIQNSGGPSVLPLRSVLKNPVMAIFTVQQFLNAGADFIYVSTMGSYFSTHNYNAVTLGLVVSLPLWGGAVGGVVGGFVNDGLIHYTGSRRWSRSIAGFTGKFLACVFMFVAVNQTNGIAAAWTLFVVKFFSDWTQPTVWGTATDLGGRFSGTVFSIVNAAGSFGGVVTPLVSGLLLDYYRTEQVVDGVAQMVTNYWPMFSLVAAMYLICALLWLFIDCTKSLESDA